MEKYKKNVETKFPSSGRVPEGRGGESQPGVTQSNKSKINKSRNSQNYFSLPFSPKLKERAKSLRKAGELSEVLFWKEVKNKQFKRFDFDRQKIIGNYIVDFYCTNKNKK